MSPRLGLNIEESQENGMEPTRRARYTFNAGKRLCNFFFQNRKPRVAQSMNSITLISDIAKSKGIRGLSILRVLPE